MAQENLANKTFISSGPLLHLPGRRRSERRPDHPHEDGHVRPGGVSLRAVRDAGHLHDRQAALQQLGRAILSVSLLA